MGVQATASVHHRHLSIVETSCFAFTDMSRTQTMTIEPSTGIMGRSRFSKALPSVPGLSDQAATPLPPLPRGPPSVGLPALPQPPRGKDETKPVKSIARKPVGSASTLKLPARSSSSTGSLPVSRRPVGGSLQPPVQPAVVLPPEPSPTDSIYNLICSYSREPSATMNGSTSASASTLSDLRDSQGRSSTGSEKSAAGSHKNSPEPPSAVKIDSSPAQNSHNRPLPLPKDGKFEPTTSQPKPLPTAPAVLDKASPSRPEIWKRRPQADKSKDLPDLKLNYSHGSTASNSSIKTAVLKAASGNEAEPKPAELPTDSLPSPPPPPPPPAKTLPGRDIQPPPKDERQETAKSMGSTASKVRSVKNKIENSHATPKTAARQDKNRPPTPEYRKGDVTPPSESVHTIAKPASPVSAAGSPKVGGVTASSNVLPQSRAESLLGSSAIASPSLVASQRKLPSAAPDLRLTTTIQDLSEDEPAASTDKQTSSARKQYPPRNSSASASVDATATARHNSPSKLISSRPGSDDFRRPASASTATDARTSYSESQGGPYRGRDGTLYAEMKVNENPDPRAFNFVTQADKPLGPGSIITSKPLRRSHFDCFQKHRTMSRKPNRNYPLTCQTCDKADTEDRWVCVFCHLRICETCMKSLNGHQRALRQFVDQLGTNTPLSLPSISRPGSAFAVEAPT